MKILIAGAGGHAQVLADVIMNMADRNPELRLVGFVDDNPALIGTTILGYPVHGPISSMAQYPHDALIVGIGDNYTRAIVFRTAQENSEEFFSAIHPQTILSRFVRSAAGTLCCAGVTINGPSRLGRNVIINTAASVDHHCDISDHVHIAPGVHLGGNVTVGEGALVGIGATVLPGRMVGAWAVVGAGAVVVSDVPARTVVTGVPAKAIREIDRPQ